MKKHYDLIFGIGPACSCSQALRRAGLQHLSFPFDWIGPLPDRPGWDGDLPRRAELLASAFDRWLDPADFVHEGLHANGKERYYNRRLNLMFLHDFPKGVPLDESYPLIAEKYRKRCHRLLTLLRKSKRALIVRLDRPDLAYRTPIEDCRRAREILGRAFAPTAFDVLLLQHDAAIPPGDCREEAVEPGILRLSLDYLDRTPGADIAQPDHRRTAAALMSRFAVRDYRTPAEIADWKRRQKLKRYAKFGATTYLGYRLARIRRALFGRK